MFTPNEIESIKMGIFSILIMLLGAILIAFGMIIGIQLPIIIQSFILAQFIFLNIVYVKQRELLGIFYKGFIAVFIVGIIFGNISWSVQMDWNWAISNPFIVK